MSQTDPSHPSHQAIQELLGAYALDAVEPDEVRLVEEHLPTCPRCRDEERAHREVASLLAWSGTEAPSHLWDRLIADLDTGGEGEDRLAPVLPMVGRPAPTAAPARRPSRVGRWLVAVAAAVVLVVGSAAVANLYRLRTDPQVVAGGSGLATEALQIADAPGTRIVHLEDRPGGIRLANAYLTEDGALYVVPLPAMQPLASGNYQLWAVKDGTRTSLGLLGATPTAVKTSYGRTDIALLAITAEDAPQGVTSSTRNPVAAGIVGAATS